MARKRTSGLYKRNGIWHIDKKVYKRRLCQSTFTAELEEAEKVLARRIEDLRQIVVYGERPHHTFGDAAAKYVDDNPTKASIRNDVTYLTSLDSFIGDLPLATLHMSRLQPYIEARQRQGVKKPHH